MVYLMALEEFNWRLRWSSTRKMPDLTFMMLHPRLPASCALLPNCLFLSMIMDNTQGYDVSAILKLADLIRTASEDAGPWIGSDGTVYCSMGSLILCI